MGTNRDYVCRIQHGSFLKTGLSALFKIMIGVILIYSFNLLTGVIIILISIFQNFFNNLKQVYLKLIENHKRLHPTSVEFNFILDICNYNIFYIVYSLSLLLITVLTNTCTTKEIQTHTHTI